MTYTKKYLDFPESIKCFLEAKTEEDIIHVSKLDVYRRNTFINEKLIDDDFSEPPLIK